MSVDSRESPATSASDWPLLCVWFVLVGLAAAGGSLATMQAPTFYAALARPEWAPPATLFGPVWSVLYLSMACAASLVWLRRHQRTVGPALLLFVLQLLVNALWSWLFFFWQSGSLATLDSLLLCFLVGATCVVFWPLHRVASLLMLPYFAWVLFATVLSWRLWQLNPGLLS